MLEKSGLSSRHGEAEVLIGQARGYAAAGRSVEESDLDEERLVDFFEGVLLLGQGSGQRAQPYWSAVLLLDNGEQEAAVDFVEAVGVHFEHGEGGIGGGAVDGARATDLPLV